MKNFKLKNMIVEMVKEILKEESTFIPYDISLDFRKFEKEIDTSTEVAKKRFQQSLKSKLFQKKVTVRASKGDANQIKTDYVIKVIGVNIAEINNEWKIYLIGEDKKRYFVDEKFKIKVESSQEEETSPETSASEESPENVNQTSPSQTTEKPSPTVGGNIVPQK